MKQFLTPLLCRLYGLLFGVLVIFGGIELWRRTGWHKQQLYRQLVEGSRNQKFSAAGELVQLRDQSHLLQALKSESQAVRSVAVQALWNLWYHEAGPEAFAVTQVVLQATEETEYQKALRILEPLLKKHPGFAEGWNRRATIYWQMGRYRQAIADCRRVTVLNPEHFGAWEGMALCQVALGEIEDACVSLRRALRIFPQDENALFLLHRCQDLLRQKAPPPGRHYEMALLD